MGTAGPAFSWVPTVDLAAGTIQNLTQGKVYQAGGFPPFLQRVIDAGGLLACLAAEKQAKEETVP